MSRYDDDDYEDDRPSRRPRSRREYDDDEFDDRPASREDARGRTLGPMIGLIAGAVIGILGNFGWSALNYAVPKQPPPANMPANQQAGYDAGYAIGAGCPGFGGLIVGLLIILGAVGVRSGNRGLAITGLVFGFIPCHPGWIITLPFGIWALVVLNDPDVQRAFRR